MATALETVSDYYGIQNTQMIQRRLHFAHGQASQVQHNKEANRLISEDNDLWKNYDEISANHICNKPLHELQQVTIPNLKVGLNPNVQLIATTIVKPRGIMNISTILKDKEGNVIVCAVYNYTPIMQHSMHNLNKILPINTKVIIKEPYIKIFQDNTPAIRIDNSHTNFMIYDHHLETKIQNNIKTDDALRALSVIELKKCGNDHYKHKYYDIAIRYYTIALQKCDNDADLTPKLLNNRALCYSKLKLFKEASKDGFKALSMDGSWDKARYTLCSALLVMKRYKQALDVLAKMDPQTLSTNNAFKHMKKTVITKVLQSSKKFNDINRTEFIALIQPETDYVSDSIKIAWINDRKGRGVVATKNIKRGEILVREKHLAFGCPPADTFYGNPRVSWECNDWQTIKTCEVSTSFENVLCDLMKQYVNGTDVDRHKISLLYDGSTRARNKVIPSMDVFRYNELPENVKKEEIPILSVRRLAQITEKNSFQCETSKAKNNGLGSAIFVLTSFFNHGVGASQNCECDGDHNNKIVFALRDIKKGEELTIAYYDDYTNTFPFDYNDP